MKKQLNKFLCIFITALFLVNLSVVAIEAAPVASLKSFSTIKLNGKTIFYKDTEEYIAVVTPEENGGLKLSYVERDNGARLIRVSLSEDVDNIADVLEDIKANRLEGYLIQTFESSQTASTMRSSSDDLLEAVEDCMRDTYGNEYSNALVGYNNYPSIGLRINIRQTLYYDAEDTGWLTLLRGIETAEAIAQVASWFDTPYRAAIALTQQILELSANVVNDMLTSNVVLPTYRGVALFERIAWIKESGDTVDSPYYVSATRNEIWHFVVLPNAEGSSLSSVNRLAVVDESEYTMYMPSEYDYQIATMLADAYDLYTS